MPNCSCNHHRPANEHHICSLYGLWQRLFHTRLLDIFLVLAVSPAYMTLGHFQRTPLDLSKKISFWVAYLDRRSCPKGLVHLPEVLDRKSTRLNSSHSS